MRSPDPNPLARWLEPPARLLVILGGWWLLLLSLATCAEVLARKLLGFSFQGIDEIGAYTLAVFSALSFALALVTKSHTRVDFLLGRMPGVLRALLNAVAYLTLAGLALFALWRGWHVLEESLEFGSRANSPLGTPLWIPQALWLLGLGAFLAVALPMALHALWLLLTDRARLNRLYGPMTLEEEVEAEAGAVLARADAKDTA